MESGATYTPESVQAELDRQLFHLKTLYDVSHELLGLLEVKAILKNFLFMTTGNFGVVHGFVLVHDVRAQGPQQMVSIGFGDTELLIPEKELDTLLQEHPSGSVLTRNANATQQPFDFLPPDIIIALPFHVDNDCTGCLGLGSKIIGEPYTEDDKDLLKTLVNNLVVSVKNARASEALQEAYEEVSSLNKAKDKAINHLSHELKTPLASLLGALAQLKRKLAPVPQEEWQRTMERADRNLQRLIDLQFEVEDIMLDREYKSLALLSKLLDQCADVLETLALEQSGNGDLVQRIRERIEESFGTRDLEPEEIALDRFVAEKIEQLKPLFSHRELELHTEIQRTTPIRIPRDPLDKLFIGLTKNSVENTPDEGKIEISVKNRRRGVELVVHDYGVGIPEQHRKRIFEGFYPTQEIIAYSSKKPFEFNAGGKGADLLRLNIFSERFGFKLDMSSSRCRHIPLESDICPGRVSTCRFCTGPDDCFGSGETVFTAFFPLPR